MVKEIEETNAGQRALKNSTFTHGPENKDRPKKDRKPDKVLVQGPQAPDADIRKRPFWRSAAVLKQDP